MDDQNNKSVYWVYFFRQLFSCGGIILNFFIFGLYMGAHTVIIPQLRKEANSTDVVSPEMASWLSSISAYSAIPWAVILPMIAFRFGRKIPMIFITLNVIIGNIVFYFSTSIDQLILSQASLGMFRIIMLLCYC
ncbi:jg6643 [Pararge aegeria aegeria]|uniref:Jg6643 protein n=1 Tax=Pararge aegeria aegeria TaxID=348720 RepID=A0A8S4RSV1_9NEOP|nr:jg6643 [Pararge aegeria aegeria]